MTAKLSTHSVLVRSVSIALFVAAFVAFHQIGDRFPAQSDFNIYYYGAALGHGQSYTNTNAVLHLGGSALPPGSVVWGTPSLVALVFKPFTLLPRGSAFALWQACTAICLFIGIRKAAGNRWPVGLAVAALSPALLLGIHLGNASVLTTALIAFAYGAWRDGESKSAGIAVGLATALKLYPGFLFIAFLVKLDKKAMAATITSFAVVTCAAIPVLGLHNFLLGISKTLSVGHLDKAWVTNSSLPGVAYWMASGSAASIVNVVGLIGGVGLVWYFRKLAPQTLFALCAGVMLLLQSVTWPHYYALSLLPLLVVLESNCSRRQLALAAAAYVPAVMLPIVSSFWASHFAPGLANAIGLIVLTSVAVATATVHRRQGLPVTGESVA